MAKAAGRGRKAAGRQDGREPDHELARCVGVSDRYVLRVGDPRDSALVLRVLADLSIPLAYLLLLPAGSPGGAVAYLGLGPHDVADLPIRFASQGVEVERGEELQGGAQQRCTSASVDAPLRTQGPTRRPTPRPGGPKRRPA